MTKIRDIIVKNTSEMLDNPDEYGIYPTTRFYNKLEKEIRSWALEERKDERKKVTEEIKKKNAPEIEKVNKYIKELEEKIEEANNEKS